MVALRLVESYNTQRSRQWEPKGEAVDCVAERALNGVVVDDMSSFWMKELAHTYAVSYAQVRRPEN